MSSVIPLTRPSTWSTPRRATRAITQAAISTMSASTTSVIVTFVLVDEVADVADVALRGMHGHRTHRDSPALVGGGPSRHANERLRSE